MTSRRIKDVAEFPSALVIHPTRRSHSPNIKAWPLPLLNAACLFAADRHSNA
ncbi:MAG: hypothetical protein P8M80_13530 [Pirellulaceae bacterium]|nr:hypothetical protein [Pirellulaceae bacterium]